MTQQTALFFKPKLKGGGSSLSRGEGGGEEEEEWGGVTGDVVSNDFALDYGSESREDEFEILVSRHRIQLAHEQHVFWGARLGVG
mmetsp:Transcript_53387/g.121707  ORF Transcript_53387/g.121707 Transcript_53387/m.121707 type:complete len:85 (-) Transcript_53387:303-557(-)